MNNLESQIIAEYRNKYFSVQQIADDLKISPSKVRYILSKFGIKKRTISEAITQLNITKFKKGNFCVKNNLSNLEKKLKIAGAMLYWGEGTKDGNTVAFSNSNPEMVVLFLRFLRKICNISEKRVRALLHIYENQNELLLKKFWSKKIKIPVSQFSKSFLHKRKGGSYRKKSDFGTISIRYSDKELLKLINKWIEEYKKID
jgi:hypothetical protein